MAFKCVFCQVHNDESHRVIYSNSHCVAVLDKYPVVQGHCLVIPRRHVEKLQDLTKVEVLSLFDAITKVEDALLSLKLGDGVDLRQHYRPFLEESMLKVNHVHFHLLPRKNNDELYSKALVNELDLRDMSGSKQKVQGLAKRIVKAIAKE